MKLLQLACMALSFLGMTISQVLAAPLTYTLDMPLVVSGDSDALPALVLRGTLSYDGDEAMTGQGRFTIGNDIDIYDGFAFLMELDGGGDGVLFDGHSTNGDELYVNVATDLAHVLSGMVNYCGLSGCQFFDVAEGASLVPSVVSVPDMPGTGSFPAIGLSPVPLPPALSLFTGALLALAGVTAGSRGARRVAIIRRYT